MPTTKKPAAKSKVATKAKKPVAHKKTAATHAAASEVRSFKLCSEPKPFMTPSLSVQTFYWIVIGVLVLLLATWAITLTVQIQAIYDNIGTSDTVLVVPHKK